MGEWLSDINARVDSIVERNTRWYRHKSKGLAKTHAVSKKRKTASTTPRKKIELSQEELERKRERERRYYAANKEKFAERRKVRKKERMKDPEFAKRAAAYQREWRKRNPEKARSYWVNHRKNNKERVARLRRASQKRKWDSDPLHNMVISCRNRTADVFRRKRMTKSKRTMKMLGCSGEEFKAHIEAQFTDGMSWENRSEWHLDHIVPLDIAESAFEVEILCHYTNVRPLWAKENQSKGAKLPSPDIIKRTRPKYQQAA